MANLLGIKDDYSDAPSSVDTITASDLNLRADEILRAAQIVAEFLGPGFLNTTDANGTAVPGQLQIQMSAALWAFVGSTGGRIPVSADAITLTSAHGLTNGATNYVYLQRTGVYIANTTGVAPANSELAISGVAAGGEFTSINNNPTGRNNLGVAATLLRTQTMTGKTLTSCGGVAGSGDLDMGGGYRQTVDGWYQDNVPAGQAATAMSRRGAGALPTVWVALRAGSITGLIVKSNAARSAGTLTAEVYKNGVATGLQAILDGTNTTFKSTTQAKDSDTFAAGDELDIRITTDGSWAPTTADVTASLEVET